MASRPGLRVGRPHLLVRAGSVAALAISLAACTSPAPVSPSTSSASTGATTTTAPCRGQATHATAGTEALTVDPGTCLHGGQQVVITGQGFKTNSPGGLAECNDASDEPTVTVEGSQVPVSCTNPVAQATSTSSTGTLDTTFPIITGYTGPPASGTDSTGGQALHDAVNFPCPPTPSQSSAGATCNIAFGDASGDQVSVPVSFAPGAKASSTKPGPTLSSSLPLG